MIAAQVVVAHLVSRSLRAFGVVSRVPFFTLHQMWLPFLVVLPLYVGDIQSTDHQYGSNKEDN